jgi:hypothetical protein
MHEEILGRSIAQLNISVRAKNALESADIKTVFQLIRKSEAELMRISGFGKNSLFEVVEVLHSFNFDLRKGREIPFEDRLQSAINHVRYARKNFERAWSDLVELQKIAAAMPAEPEKTKLPDLGTFE